MSGHGGAAPAGGGGWLARWPGGWIVGLARLGPLGRSPVGPGTVGSLAGVAFYAALLGGVPSLWLLAGAVPVVVWAAGVCGEAERRLGQRDPGGVILDEFVAMPLVFLGWEWWPAGWPGEAPWPAWVAGFALFRLFDIAKPLGIARLQDLPGGWGVMADDVAAALAAAACLHGLAWAWVALAG